MEADSGRRRDPLTSEEREELKRLRRQNFERRRASAILKDASVYFASGARPNSAMVTRHVEGAADDFESSRSAQRSACR
jgi:transposase-like protein